ncbi:aldehyde dehydrogenase (NADP(+)) [Aquimarina brevivitae]|uniref:NADP-dependent aldehyde dehydrogenase n=1 Tax=Aquimarina brevivitae TaxID=323412 RepID=A0A4Q7PGS1_9FLAO|nr:aldehyde dehydrogenase (NADP(+)) [Aquimarina brevivitae]RZS99721.1 NADP-dependent aldehyde dehydrogenase [Aquimarina brevivitae]
MITGKNQIGNTLSALSKNTFRTFNPALSIANEPLFYEASDQEIEKAMQLADEAYATYKNVSGAQKADFLDSIADEIIKIGDVLISTYIAETGLPEGRAIGERGRTVNQLKAFAELLREGSWIEATIDTALPDREPVPKPDIRKMNIPIGPVVVFGASNFPLAFSTAGGDTASALAAGCPVIVKSHPLHAGTGELVAAAIAKAAAKTQMPNGVFSNLNSSGIEVGQKLVSHPLTKAVGFTGSFKAGKALLDLAAQRKEPIPVFAEMGSVNPVILLREALQNNSKELATTYAQSITLGAGQFCTNPGLLIGLQSKALDQFIALLTDQLNAISPSCMLHPSIQQSYENNKSTLIAQSGVQQLTTSNLELTANYGLPSLTTVSGSDFINNPQLHQEVFGPLSLLVRCKNIAEALQVINSLEGQLTGTVMADKDDISHYPQLIDSLSQKVGRLIFNGAPTGVEVCPAMTHGGPYPATTDSRFTSVGTAAIYRWVRPLSYQNWPDALLPDALKNKNPLQLYRRVNGALTNTAI